MPNLKQIAGELYDAFQTKTRDNGDEFVCLKDGSPEWMTDAIRAAHNNADMLPDDWRYAAIKEAAGAIYEADDGADIADVGDQFADGVDVYTHKLWAWVSSHSSRMAYVDEAVNEFGPVKEFSLSQALMWGQAAERREVFDQLVQFLEGMADDEVEGEE